MNQNTSVGKSIASFETSGQGPDDPVSGRLVASALDHHQLHARDCGIHWSCRTKIPVWVQITLGLISVALVMLDVHSQRRRIHGEPAFSRARLESFATLSESIQANPNYSVRSFRHGTLAVDTMVSEALRTGDIEATAANTAYVIPSEIRTMGNLYRRSRVRRNPHAYNEPVLGLSSISTAGQVNSLNTVDAFYWDHLATDQLAMVDTRVDDEVKASLGRSLFMDRHGNLRDFGSSWLLNAIGVSVLAITTDGHFVVVMQSSNNDSARGLYAPTGSGSLEPQDYNGATAMPAARLLANGAMREAAEESAIAPEDVEDVFPLGFGRWLQKAAKPEAFFVAFLKIDSHEIRKKKIPAADRAYTKLSEPRRFRLENPSDWRSGAPTDMVHEEITSSMSLPLEACLALLAEAVEQKDPDICKLLGPRLRTKL